MRFIQDTTYRVKPEKAEEFQAWYIANRQRLEDDYPPGTALVGAFVTVYGPGEGELHLLEQFDSYGALDTMAEHMREPKSRDLGHEFSTFLDLKNGQPTTRLMKDVVDATVMNMAAEETPELATV